MPSTSTPILPGSSVWGILPAGIPEWVAVPFSRGSSQSRDWAQVSWITSRFFIIWATRETLVVHRDFEVKLGTKHYFLHSRGQNFSLYGSQFFSLEIVTNGCWIFILGFWLFPLIQLLFSTRNDPCLQISRFPCCPVGRLGFSDLFTSWPIFLLVKDDIIL